MSSSHHVEALLHLYGISVSQQEFDALCNELSHLDEISHIGGNAFEVVFHEIFCFNLKGKDIYVLYDIDEQDILAILHPWVFEKSKGECMKLFLDDVRDPPDNTWIVARDGYTAAMYLLTNKVEVLSLDHDLGEWSFPEEGIEKGRGITLEAKPDHFFLKSGYDVVNWVEQQVALRGFRPPKMLCHSANPVGRRRIEQVIDSVKRMTDAEGD